MSRWCGKCFNEEYPSCNEQCIIFGKDLEELSKICFELQKQYQWIPCSERLPISINKEPYGTNLVVLNTNEVMIGIYRNHAKKWVVRNFEELNYHISNEVIAWMPLPTYKEETK